MAARDLVAAFTPSVEQAIYLLLGIWSVWFLGLAAQRLWLSPLAHYPGPKLAALTQLCEFYYDIILGGQYTFKISALHKKYGPVGRISPWEVLNIHDFQSELYGNPIRPLAKWSFCTRQFGAPCSVVATIDHNHHKLRRNALNPFLSTQQVRNLQPVIEERVDALLHAFAEYANTVRGKPLSVMYPFSAFSNDVINEYAFARGDRLSMPSEEKTPTRLAQEGQALVQGGTLTTSSALSLATWHLGNNPSTLRKLRDELFATFQDPHDAMSLAQLESLPYLWAVVKESIRLSTGTSGQLARVASEETLVCRDPESGEEGTFPPGTVVSMSPYMTPMDASVFEDPLGFHSERWLKDSGNLEKYSVTWGGGTRSCLGRALTHAELHLMLAKFFRRWGSVTMQGRKGIRFLLEACRRAHLMTTMMHGYD